MKRAFDTEYDPRSTASPARVPCSGYGCRSLRSPTMQMITSTARRSRWTPDEARLRHRVRPEIDSEPGRGAVFRVRVPLVEITDDADDPFDSPSQQVDA